MRRTIPFLACLALAACAANSAEQPAPTLGSGGNKCNGDGLSDYVGRKATAELGAELLARSGARTLRWGPPGAAMTMDFREDRLTVSYDADMTVTRLSCG